MDHRSPPSIPRSGERSDEPPTVDQPPADEEPPAATADNDDAEEIVPPAIYSSAILGQLLRRLRIDKDGDCPPIPLCRMVANPVVRAVSSNLETHEQSFRVRGYVDCGSPFIVAVGGEFTPEMMFKLNAHERHQHLVFEAALFEPCNAKWREILSMKTVLVYEGNHRLTAWRKFLHETKNTEKEEAEMKLVIEERTITRRMRDEGVLNTDEKMNSLNNKIEDLQLAISTARKWYPEVKCAVIDIPEAERVNLLSAMQNLNLMHSKAVQQLTFPHSLMLLRASCDEAKEESYLQRFSGDERALISKRKAEESRGSGTWYPLTRWMHARIHWGHEIVNELNAATSEKEKKVVRRRYMDKVQKMLGIVNPALGDEWYKEVTSFDASKMSFLGIEKLSRLATAKVPIDEKLKMLRELIIVGRYGMQQNKIPLGDKPFMPYWDRRVFSIQVLESAKRIVESIAIREGLEQRLSEVEPLSKYLLRVTNKYLNDLYPHVHTTKDVDKQKNVVLASRRLAYRYFNHFLSAIEQPIELEDWTNQKAEVYMYGDEVFAKRSGLTAFERQRCPWWLDLPKQVVPQFEKEEWDAHVSDYLAEKSFVSAVAQSQELMATEWKKSTYNSLAVKSASRKRRHGTREASSSVVPSSPDKVVEEQGQDVQDETETEVPREKQSKPRRRLRQQILGSRVVQVVGCKDMMVDRDTPKPLIDFLTRYSRADMHQCSLLVADLVVLNLPSGLPIEPESEDVPDWNIVNEMLVPDALKAAVLLADDKTWIAVLCMSKERQSVLNSFIAAQHLWLHSEYVLVDEESLHGFGYKDMKICHKHLFIVRKGEKNSTLSNDPLELQTSILRVKKFEYSLDDVEFSPWRPTLELPPHVAKILIEKLTGPSCCRPHHGHRISFVYCSKVGTTLFWCR